MRIYSISIIYVVAIFWATQAGAGMQAEKMLRDIAVNHDLQKVKHSILINVRSELFASKKDKTLQQARNGATEK